MCPPGAHHGCCCCPGSCSTALWDTGHPGMTTLMNLSALCPVAPVRSILVWNKSVWLTQTQHTLTPCSHRFKHTFLVVPAAHHIINTNWPFFMVTNIFHMFWKHLGSLWPQQKLTWLCTWEWKRDLWELCVCVCGQDTQLSALFAGSFIVCTTQLVLKSVKCQSVFPSHLHSQAYCQNREEHSVYPWYINRQLSQWVH